MTHHRVRIYEVGGPDVLRYEPTPEPIERPGAGQVRLRHEAIGLNFVDTLFRNGSFAMPLPLDMGIEGAGVVQELGPGVTHLAVGDRVAYFFSPGAYSDVRLIAADALVKLPATISTKIAAAILTKGLTAWMLVKRVHAIKPGDVALVQGATGGVGLLVAEWARALGATVIATASSDQKARSLRARGFDHVLSSDSATFVEQIRDLTGGQGVDVVYEMVGKTTFASSIEVLRKGGSFVHLGSASGEPEAKDRTEIERRMIRYSQPVTGHVVNGPAVLTEASEELFAAYERGDLGEIDPVFFKLQDIVLAHKAIADRQLLGPAVILP